MVTALLDPSNRFFCAALDRAVIHYQATTMTTMTTMTTNDETISVLNDLIETCEDGIKGFRAAASAVKDARMKSLFTSRTREIENASTQLAAEVRKLGGDAESSGSASGAVHRGWIDLKAAITGGSDEAGLTECERGEDHAVKG